MPVFEKKRVSESLTIVVNDLYNPKLRKTGNESDSHCPFFLIECSNGQRDDSLFTLFRKNKVLRSLRGLVNAYFFEKAGKTVNETEIPPMHSSKIHSNTPH